jgi:hypothetical protein
MQLHRLARARLDPYLILLLVLSSFVLIPLLAPGYFYAAHDGRHSVFYIAMFDASLADGALWPRWAMHHIQGYGYPTFVIQAPLGFYIGAFFSWFGIGYTAAAKLVWVLAFYASAWGLYALVRYLVAAAPHPHVWPEREQIDPVRAAALVAGLIYVYAPYHLVDIYVRGALNDTLLLAWFPWVLLAFDRLIARGGEPGWTRRLGTAILVLAGTLLTHSFALISFAPFLVFFVLFRLGLAWTEHRGSSAVWPALAGRTVLAGAGGIGALLLTSTFLFPLIVEGQHLQQQVYVTNTYDFRNHFVYFGQFFSPFWGFGFSDDPAGVNDGMSFQVGLMPLLMLIVGLLMLFEARAGQLLRRGHMLFFALATLALLFLMMPLAAPLWEAIGPLSVIQFPWRLLALTILAGATFAGLVTANLLMALPYRTEAPGGALVLGLLVILASYGYIGAALQPVEDWREDGRAVFRFEQEHPDMIAYTEWVEEPFRQSPMTADYAADGYYDFRGQTDALTRLAIIDGTGEVLEQDSGGSGGGGLVRMETPGVVRIHLFYFPGWQVTVDGVPVAHRVSSPDGVLEIDVPAGQHRIDAQMGATPVRTAGTVISWIMLAIAVALLLWPAGHHSNETAVAV